MAATRRLTKVSLMRLAEGSLSVHPLLEAPLSCVELASVCERER